MTYRILVIEDDRDLAELIQLHLKALDAQVQLAFDGQSGLRAAQAGPFDLLLLDLMLPGDHGFDICRRLRAAANQTPILMLSSQASESDRVTGLELGADDYMTKPFSVLELLARAKAIFRRAAFAPPPSPPEQRREIRSGDMVIDRQDHAVTVGGRRVDLTAKEFELLWHLARQPGRVFSRQQLLDEVWGYHHFGYQHTVNSHINRLRGKIEHDPARPEFVLTVWGVGYKFAVEASAEQTLVAVGRVA